MGVAEEFLLGRFAVAAGDITVETLNLVLADRARFPGTRRLFGAELVARGLLSETQLRQAMTRQTSELVYEVLRWTTGRFGFQRMIELPELARSAGLAIAVDAMLLEGFRRIDEWRIIQREIDNAVRDIIRELRMGSFDVSKILFRLLRTRLIRRRVAPVAT